MNPSTNVQENAIPNSTDGLRLIPAWKPRPHLLESIKSYFNGYPAHGKDIYAKRKYIAKKLGISIRTLARYLAYLAEIGWMETAWRTPRTAVRRVAFADLNRDALKAMPYRAFIATEFWRLVRLKVLNRDRERCVVCRSTEELQVHHKTYKNHGYEDSNLDDLITLCLDCHSLFHSKLGQLAELAV